MAYEIARAYDSDKNLVPLYVMSDGEIWNNYPETPNAFKIINVGLEGNPNENQTLIVSITSDAMNPVGGQTIENLEYPMFKQTSYSWNTGITAKIKIINDLNFNLRCSFTLTFNRGTSTGGNWDWDVSPTNNSENFEMAPNSQTEFTWEFTSRRLSGGGDKTLIELSSFSVVRRTD